MDVRSLLDEYDRTKRIKRPPVVQQDPRNLYISALAAGAGLDSLVSAHLSSKNKSNDIKLSQHPQFEFFRALLGNLPDTNDALVLLEVRGFSTEAAYHESRKKAMQTREQILSQLEEYREIETKLKEMTNTENWPGKAASLVADIRDMEEKMGETKPELNAWVKAYTLMKSLAPYPTYEALVQNFSVDKGDLFGIAAGVASALGERAVAFFFKTVDGATGAEAQNVRKALRYIAWNMTYNSFQVAGLTGEGKKTVLPIPFDKATVEFSTSEVTSKQQERKTFKPVVDGDEWMNVLRALDAVPTIDAATDSIRLQAFHLSSRNNLIISATGTLGKSLLGDESHPLDALDIRAESLLTDTARPPDLKVDQGLATTTAHPFIETIREWVATVYEPQQQSLSQRALELIKEIRGRIETSDPEGRMWSAPKDVLEMEDIPVDGKADLPFKPAVVAAMDRVASLVHDNVHVSRPGLYTRHVLLNSSRRIIEKFAHATAKQMIMSATVKPQTRPKTIMYIGAASETAAAIAEVANAILEN